MTPQAAAARDEDIERVGEWGAIKLDLAEGDRMKDWADEGWLNFVSDFSIDEDAIPRARLLDMKEAWLHGARTALSQAQAAIAANRIDGKEAE
jgi:hypothetical protein